MRNVGEVLKRLISGTFLMVIFAIASLIACLLMLGIDVPLTAAQIALLGGGSVAGFALGAFVPAVSGMVFGFLAALFGSFGD